MRLVYSYHCSPHYGHCTHAHVVSVSLHNKALKDYECQDILLMTIHCVFDYCLRICFLLEVRNLCDEVKLMESILLQSSRRNNILVSVDSRFMQPQKILFLYIKNNIKNYR